MASYQEAFGQNLKRIMEDRGKSHIDLVNDLGIPSATVTSWTKGVRIPKLDKVQILADYLKCDIFELLEDGDTYRLRNQATQLQKMYMALDEHGRNLLLTIARMEYERCAK